ncbi:unnamed protein product, partial [Ranitomeya imitator]
MYSFTKILNLVFYYSECEGRRRTFSSCSNDSLSASGTPVTPRRISWRQRIFLRVASPMTNSPSDMQHTDHIDGNDLLPLSPFPPTMEEDPLTSLLQDDNAADSTDGKRTAEHLQRLWRKAIHQQILLLRMEKENLKLEASRDELQSRKIKLDYEEVGMCQKDVSSLWDKKLNCKTKIRFDMEEIYATLKEGVPKCKRGEIWQFLSVQYRLRHRLPSKQQPPDMTYSELLKQLTAQQHAILVDLGRTFPTHPYFSAQLGAGQLSLYNLLKAYSLLDKEVGYCQGISFVAGVLLLHMSEQQAFEMLKFLMYDLAFRKQYRPDMMSLQIQMYQLSRLLHDYHRDLYNHLEENEISPSLYAAPWFLTLFASQFSLGFVARVFAIKDLNLFARRLKWKKHFANEDKKCCNDLGIDEDLLGDVRFLFHLGDPNPNDLGEGPFTDLKNKSKRMPPPTNDLSAVDVFVNLVTNEIMQLDKIKKRSVHNFTKAEMKSLCELEKDHDRIIKPSDKGGNVVVMDVPQYKEMCYALLNADMGYERLKGNPTEVYHKELKELPYVMYRWEKEATDSSLRLMRLLLEEEKVMLSSLSENLREQIEVTKKFSAEPEFVAKEIGLQNTIDKFQYHLKERKHRFFIRDLQEFRDNKAYLVSNPKPFRPQDTDISSSEAEVSDTEG